MNVRIDKTAEKEKEKKQQKLKSGKQKAKKEKHIRTPKEATALMLGMVALLLTAAGAASLLWLSTLVGAVLGGIGVLTGFASLIVGKGGTLPAVIAVVGGFLTVLSAIVSMKLG